MGIFPEEALEQLLLRATAWAMEQEQAILENGQSLDEETFSIAVKAGVKEPARVRIRIVQDIPLPEDEDLRRAAISVGLGGRTAGQALGYGICLLEEHAADPNVVAHELVHVAQYERHRGILNFFKTYFMQCFVFGYHDAPLEREAEQIATAITR